MHTACLAAKIKCLAESNNIHIGIQSVNRRLHTAPPCAQSGPRRLFFVLARFHLSEQTKGKAKQCGLNHLCWRSGSLVQWLPRHLHRPPLKACTLVPTVFGVDFGRPRYREHYRGYHDYGYDRRRGGCRTVTIERAGSVRTINRRLHPRYPRCVGADRGRVGQLPL